MCVHAKAPTASRTPCAPPNTDVTPTPVSVILNGLREDSSFSADYTLGEKLGEGAYSTVFTGTHTATGEVVAVKLCPKARMGSAEIGRLTDEVAVMASLQHPHIVRLLAFYEDSDTYYLVLELMTGGELFDRIVRRSHYSEREARDVLRTLAEAVAFLHGQGIVHRDLKPENILHSSSDDSVATIKIADMGFSKRVPPEGCSTSCGTPSYVAPEILSGSRYGREADCWSLGVIAYILLAGYAPFSAGGSNQAELFRAIVSGRFYFDSPYWDNVSEGAKDLIRRLLVVDPARRLSAAGVLKHPWLHGTVASRELSSALSQMRGFQANRKKVLRRGLLIKRGHFVRGGGQGTTANG